jgi:DNA polymerase V
MGVPHFKIRDVCEEHKVILFSSNFELYRDISRRVMSVLKRFSENLEIYSIDEAFAELSNGTTAEKIRWTVLKEVGVPVSVGVSHTKTLAKVASHFAKPKSDGVGHKELLEQCDIDDALQEIEIGDVWGIGRQYSKKLKRYDVFSAQDLLNKSDEWVRKKTNMLGLQTVAELRGTQCLEVGEDPELRKSLVHSQSFGKPVYKLSELRASVARHARAAAETLRAEEAVARHVSVFIRTSRHKYDKYTGAYDMDILGIHTNDTLKIVESALSILERLYKRDVGYAKAGVYVRDIVPEGAQPQETLFKEKTGENKLMEALDALHFKYGVSVKTGAEIEEGKWRAKRNHLSPRRTTRWDEVATVHLLD